MAEEIRRHDGEVEEIKKALTQIQSSRNPEAQYRHVVEEFGYDWLAGLSMIGSEIYYVPKNNNMLRYRDLWSNMVYQPRYEIDYVDPAFTDFYSQGRGSAQEDEYWDDEGDDYWGEEDDYWGEEDDYWGEEDDYWGEEDNYSWEQEEPRMH